MLFILVLVGYLYKFDILKEKENYAAFTNIEVLEHIMAKNRVTDMYIKSFSNGLKFQSILLLGKNSPGQKSSIMVKIN